MDLRLSSAGQVPERRGVGSRLPWGEVKADMLFDDPLRVCKDKEFLDVIRLKRPDLEPAHKSTGSPLFPADLTPEDAVNQPQAESLEHLTMDGGQSDQKAAVAEILGLQDERATAPLRFAQSPETGAAMSGRTPRPQPALAEPGLGVLLAPRATRTSPRKNREGS